MLTTKLTRRKPTKHRRKTAVSKLKIPEIVVQRGALSDPRTKTVSLGGKQLLSDIVLDRSGNTVMRGGAESAPVPSSVKFELPVVTTGVNTIQINQSGRYIRIRPSQARGDGWLLLKQIVVTDANGNNIAKGKPIFATATNPWGQSPTILVNGITTM